MAKQQLVWDLPVRIFHWCFVGVLLALWYTSDQDSGLIELHIKLGYTALGLTLFRILWGFVGTTHAKFVNFIPRPHQLKIYFQQLRAGKVKSYIGHNPLGSLMVIFILIAVLLQATSGLFISDDIFSAGPYNGVLSAEFEKLLKMVHTNGFNIIATLSVIHIFAVFYYLIIKKQNLIKPMFTGKKLLDNGDSKYGIKHSKLIKAIIVALGVVLFVYWLVVINAPVIEEYYY
ncbi:cytochrome b/b6 domain-containing protein [Thalassotalea sp. SU-HH00458]|uniref:cytochrome b/b6 domain-containing protein n=1 Tax=Thalassotalea sp. SU-HH00458 TaxID=3127657 RepID=UPI00310BCD31